MIFIADQCRAREEAILHEKIMNDKLAKLTDENNSLTNENASLTNEIARLKNLLKDNGIKEE
jgi:cell division protein FtsB